MARVSWRVDALAVAALAAIAWMLYGPGSIGYDMAWALEWGEQIAGGGRVDFETAHAPTPHPLANLFAVPLSWLGADAAIDVTIAASFVAFGALAWFGFRLGDRLFHPAAGILVALVLLTRPVLVNETVQALVDIPFLALVAAASVAAASERRRDVLVLVLLVAAGLLRPEGWGLGLLYALWAARDLDARGRASLVGLALVAPIAWALFDLVVTGDPLWSLHGTRALAEELDRPRGLGEAAEATPQYLRALLGTYIAWGGVAGAALAISVLYERAVAPVAVGALGLAGFLVLGAAGLPVLTRYLLVPGAVAVLMYAAGVVAWRLVEPGSRMRGALAAAAVALVALGLTSVPPTARGLDSLGGYLDRRREAQRDLREIARDAQRAGDLDGCRRLAVADHQGLPLLALWLDRPLGEIFVAEGAAPAGAAYFAFTDPKAANSLRARPRSSLPVSAGPPEARRARNATWSLYVRCSSSA